MSPPPEQKLGQFFYLEHKEKFAHMAERDRDKYMAHHGLLATFDPDGVVVTERFGEGPIDSLACAALAPKTTVALQKVRALGRELWLVYASVGSAKEAAFNEVSLAFAYLFDDDESIKVGRLDEGAKGFGLVAKYALTFEGAELIYTPVAASPDLGVVEVLETHKRYRPTTEAVAFEWYDSL